MTHRPAVWMRAAGAAALLVGAPELARADEVGIVLEAGYADLTNASRSAEAVFDGSSGGFTGGAQVRFSLGRRFFAAGGARYFSRTGERVFVADEDAPVFPLGHPLEVRLLPVFGLLGYRFSEGKLAPYASLGAGAAWYREESTVGGITTSESRTKFTAMAMLGAEYGQGTIRFGAELGYSLIPNAVGLGGVSAVYGEDDLGGLSIVGRVVIVP
ncbi:MAG TPA: outer membrane beta-barrel protein [Vicinamibacteria bacterium]|jgi:hypothetical protein